MAQTFRHPEILEIARQRGKVVVEDLAAHFEVTVQTIRRDLAELAEAGKLERVHGGAILASGVANIGYEERRTLHTEAKAEIARRCARDIPENCSVFINIGTSTEAVARELLYHRNLMVVTNNMNVANILAGNPNCEVIVAGGTLRRSDGGLVGNLTVDTIRQFKFDLAVIGCSGLDEDGDMLDYDIQEVNVSRTILNQSRRAFLVSDHSKFQRSAPARIGPISELDALYTNKPLPGALAQKCIEWDVDVILPEPEMHAASGKAAR
ncbi:transcriptional regulator, DeoR family [Poseidonocella pacifica]|uniref:Transcriptional regulator, DeoR family n=1 Tax=Poseidonocella pacifica TaxID=871651 RepID=A0A1I0WG98_9RHOB|nr:DeoR/GlpR family DNA-binding transcription regulator [Poseidonocella pacifica]SFA87417.1 transcriptional regulator, DeoR family [Poseidonocella pacifica]